MTKSVKLTTRPSRVNGVYEGYPNWLAKWVDALSETKPFKTGGALWGAPVGPGFGTGQMPLEWAAALETFRPNVTYIVFSYWTPIALWVNRKDDGFWVVPPVKYSMTTSHHQSLITNVIGHTGEHIVSDLADLPA